MARILIVDDNEEDRLFLQAALGHDVHEYYFASNGNVAQQVLASKPVDLIITDVAMPGQDGLEFIREIRADGCVLPIIAVSGVRARDLDLAEDLGAGAVLPKPLDRDALVSTVEECLAAPRRRIWDSYSRGG